MAQQKQLREEIFSNNNFKLLTKSYQEHAIGQMNYAKYSVLASRHFSEDLENIFSNVKTSYKNFIFGKNMKNIVKKNGKQAWILITANQKLYGDLMIRLSNIFIENVKNTDPKKIDLIIIGRQGKKIFDEQSLNRTYKFIEQTEFNVTLNFLRDISKDLINYEDIVVFYGKFNNLVSQTPIRASIAGGQVEPMLKEKLNTLDDKKKLNFIFEPSIQEIIAFFENQILNILLNQSLQEGQLARFASRINAMETAQQNIEKKLKLLTRQERVLKTMNMNKKRLEILTGRKLWRKE